MNAITNKEFSMNVKLREIKVLTARFFELESEYLQNCFECGNIPTLDVPNDLSNKKVATIS